MKRKPPKAFTEEETEKICMNCEVADKCRVYKLVLRLDKSLEMTYGCTEFNDGSED